MLTQNEAKIMAEIYEEAGLKPIMARPSEFQKYPKKSLLQSHQPSKPLRVSCRH